MPDIGVAYTLSTPGGNVAFNNGATDQLYIVSIEGLGGPPVRSTVDPVPFGHGGIVHRAWKGPRDIVVDGMFLILSTRVGNSIVVIRNAFEETLRTALESIMQADGTLTWTPQGQGARSLTVRHSVQLEFRHDQDWLVENFSFGLVAANPNW